jgi:UDP-glucose 4-epimerase
MVLELLDAGEQVVVLDNLSTGFRWAIPQEATLVGDVGDQAIVSSIIDSTLHFAAKIVVPE